MFDPRGVRVRRYDEVVEVRKGRVDGQEAPAYFVWRDRVWMVTAVAAQWVETGSWWDHRRLHALLGVGADGCADDDAVPASLSSVVGERDVWRVEAARGQQGARGVFDLAFDWANGQWRLVSCLD